MTRTIPMFCGFLLMATCLGTTAIAGEVNFVATGISTNQDGSGTWTAEGHYLIRMEDVHDHFTVMLKLEHYRNGLLLDSFPQWIDLGAQSDGINCVSGGKDCSGNCKVLVETDLRNGTCVKSGTKDKDQGVKCMCSTGSTSLAPLSDLQPGDTLIFVLDPDNAIQEQDESDNQSTLVFQ